MALRGIASAEVAALPAVDRVMHLGAVGALARLHGRAVVLAAVREELKALRESALAGGLDGARLEDAAIATAVAVRVEHALRSRLVPLYNLTGTVLHTNFGRAVLPASAVEAVVAAMQGPVALEYDLSNGRRGERDEIAGPLLAELAGAEAATIVNNGAAALVLALAALAARREVVVSRGELIEIGGSFRLPDLMRAAGVRLVEVGTTNRTRLDDYAEAIGPRTALVLKVHPSNYEIRGFTAEVPVTELAPLARSRALPLCVDLGSGALVDLARHGLSREPVVAETVAAGADLVLFSGDKLLGGPQAGLIVGREALVRRLNRHPLKRALRAGKLTLAALEAVLGLYRSPDTLAERLTTLAWLTRDADSIREQAERLKPGLAQALAPAYTVEVVPCESEVGSGAQPGRRLASHALAIGTGARGARVVRLARRLRALERPVIGRLSQERLLLDLRCLAVEEEARFALQFERLNA